MSNPFEGMQVATRPTSGSNAIADVASSREIAEVQSMVILAKRFPRDQIQAMDRILVACQRPTLAESALYSYARGGSEITGPSIRLAEAIAQNWQNIQFGIRELDQRNGESTVEAYAWDLETNTRQSKVFQVRHERYTKKGKYALEDPRDIYEMTANQGARRMRACILGVIPGDVVEAAVKQCEETLKSKADTSPEATKKMVEAFGAFGVTKDQIEKRIQRRLDSITPAQVISLRKIYNSLKDAMSSAADWFAVQPQAESEDQVQKSGSDVLKSALKGKKKVAESKPEPTALASETPMETQDFAPDVCPDGGPMSGDRPTAEYCNACGQRQGCPVYE